MIARYQATGDQELLGQLFEPYMELLYGVCLKYLKNRTEAQDAVMDVYLHVSKKLKDHKVLDLRPWLYVVTRNLCLEKLRKINRRTAKETAAQAMYSEVDFHPDDIKESLLITMESCMKKLNEQQHHCISAFYHDSLSYEEISEKLNLSWNQVRTNIQNGRRKLKTCMQANAPVV